MNDSLRLGVLLLQEVYGFPQVQQLGVLGRDGSGVRWAWGCRRGWAQGGRGGAGLTFSSAVSARCRRRQVMLTRLCSKAATRLA